MKQYTATIIKSGNSYALRVPKQYVVDADLAVGEKVYLAPPRREVKQDRQRIAALFRHCKRPTPSAKSPIRSPGNATCAMTGHSPAVNRMVLLDTNIFIYVAQGELPATVAVDTDIAHASITKIEALGYGRLPTREMLALSELFDRSYALPLIEPIVDTAIALRQRYPLGLGDAIIAATALEHELALWTANVDDFKHIAQLTLINPLTATGHP